MIPLSVASSRRREKTVVSCSFCRRRKLRCDRQHPCSACERRGKPEECSYTSSEQERKNAVDYRPHGRPQKAQQRLARLEQLVTEMRDRENNTSHVPAGVASGSDPSNGVETLGPGSDAHISDNMAKLNMNDESTTYTGSSHWVTVFETIQDLKDDLGDEDSSVDFSSQAMTPDTDRLPEPTTNTRVSLLNNTNFISRQQILAMVPPRKDTDRYVAYFFNTFDMGPYFLYREKFLTEYDTFWVNPASAPTTWLALLFSILTMSTYLQQRESIANNSLGCELNNITEMYRTLTIQCLISADYTRPSRYTMEALLIHYGLTHNVTIDTDAENWMLIGNIVRVAMRMGMHRDPSHWPNIKPLQAELRRRFWMALYQIDFLTSASVGLPRNISDSQCDTGLPRHLFEHDLTPETEELPPERPATDETPLLLMIQRHTIVRMVAKIYDTTEATSPSAATIAKLDSELKTVIESIPARMRYSSAGSSITDQPALVLHRMFLDILLHKAIYLLHRRSFMKNAEDEDNSNSNKLCIDAAFTILAHQRRLIEETQPGGVVSSYRWKVAPTVNHEFLQATMMLCLALSRLNQRSAPLNQLRSAYRRDEILDTLRATQSIWESNSSTSVEARRAARAIASVLKKDANTPGGSIPMPSDEFLDDFEPWESMAIDTSALNMDSNLPEFSYDFIGSDSQK